MNIVKLELPIVLMLLFISGCITCPPTGKEFYQLTDEEANKCQFYCSTSTDEFYNCTNAEGTVQP